MSLITEVGTTDLNSTEKREDMTTTGIMRDSAITMAITTTEKVTKAKERTCTKLWTTIPAKNHSGLKNMSTAPSSTAKEFLANVTPLDMEPSKRPKRSAALNTKSTVRHPPTTQNLQGITAARMTMPGRTRCARVDAPT